MSFNWQSGRSLKILVDLQKNLPYYNSYMISMNSCDVLVFLIRWSEGILVLEGAREHSLGPVVVVMGLQSV